MDEKQVELERGESAPWEMPSGLRADPSHQADADLLSHAEELVNLNHGAVDRELRIIELKNEINALCERLGEQARYSLDCKPAAVETDASPRLPGEDGNGLVSLDSVLRTEELQRRPARPPDYERETRALSALMQALADAPRTILQTLADKVVEVLGAQSAGLSLLTRDGRRFYWAAIAGAWSPHMGGGTPRDFGPCGDVLDCNAALLFKHWERRYPYLSAATPLAEEGLLVPFFVGGKAVGTLWAIVHDANRRFDAEDLRLLESLSHFASAAYQAVESQGEIDRRRAAISLMEDAIRARQAIAESEARLRQLADAMPQIVWTARPDGNIDYLNRRWSEFTGMPQTASNESWSQIVHPDELPRGGELWAASVETGAPFEMEMRLWDRRQQGYRWHLIRTVAVYDEAGNVARWFGTGTDIDEHKRAEESARFMAAASSTLASVVDYESTLQKVAALAVPQFADWCAVDMVNDDGTLRRLAVLHVDPAKVKLAHDLAQRYPADPASPHGVHQVLRTGESDMMVEISDALLVQGAKDDDHLRMLRELGLRSYMCVPLKGRAKVLGVITFVSAESGRRYTPGDMAFAEELANRATIAIENAQLYWELREADRLKDEFLAMLAHELRNPLAPIRNSLYILKQPNSDEQLSRQVVDIAERQVQHMARLLDDLLDVSRISRGKIELRREPLDLTAVVNRSVEAMRPLFEQGRHELTVSLPPTSLRVEGDATRLEQVLTNLLNNAAKYTDAGGRIRVTIERQGNDAVVRVRDSGIGIAPDMLPRIFDLFVQAERRLDRSQGGVGIGLTLVRKLVELHGGRVRAQSEGVGKGSEFVVSLPTIAERERSEGAAADDDEARPLPKCRVLVVDDNPDSADTLALLLRFAGQEVRTAYDGPAALAEAQAFRPEVVFLDIGMPGMDGYQVARQLRNELNFRDQVLVALTGWGQDEDRRRSEEAGFDRHLVKPVEMKVLMDLFRELRRHSSI